MCKCCQSCLETIWWHLIEKRFCYDENIALYDVEKIHEEKNNNIFENMAFFDSVSVIAGRSVVTIDSPKKFQIPVIQQPRLSIISNSSQTNQNRISLEKTLSKSTPDILKTHKADPNELDASSDTEEALQMPSYLTETKSDVDIPRSRISLDPMPNTNTLSPTTESRKKSLMERRTSKSLNLRIECVGDHCREVPIIRQNSMPKFFLETPESHQIESAIFKPTSSALTIPVPVTNRHGFVYDLSSVVQMEKERVFNSHQVPDRGNKKQFRDKIIKLRRIKSSTSVFQSHHM